MLSGNLAYGVAIVTGAANNTIAGNLIGTDITGSAALPNLSAGVLVNAPGNTIGGSQPVDRNVISGNGGAGILIVDAPVSGGAASGNLVSGNYIGMNLAGTAPLGNAGDGVLIAASSNTVGRTLAGVGIGNVITGNGGRGVAVVIPASNNVIFANSIFSNGELGIDLGGDGVTANDTDDVDAGANGLQNFPVLSNAVPVVH